jgi:uncharacterized protein YqjF (DUF2071 family)
MEPLSVLPPHEVAHPAMLQVWRDLTFLHWAYSPEAVRGLVPRELELDLWDGAAWVGLVPFAIERLTPPGMPAIPWLSNFLETNVRTYVVDRQGRRGVWFFSLDAARLAAVIGARSAYALPYYWAKMHLERKSTEVRYQGRRLSPAHPGYAAQVGIGERIASPSEFEVFLTARFRLYAYRWGKLLLANVEHPPWPLQEARVMSLKQDLVQASGLPSALGEAVAHFAGRVEVKASWPEVVGVK